ncbi:hypothetical protein [uncultured Enorma sp.]|uniref:hypothetical protein n=1 Tax=uncultured Enorma sp. TaxID=1714346 RepID=UPI0028039304|nr:hypothetical protein [uncultured Enorma sp.]
MQDFMKGRYGVDDLSTALGAVGLVLALLGTLSSARFVSIVALIVIVVALLRAFSKNFPARRREDEQFCTLMAHVPVIGERFKGGHGGYRPNPGSSNAANFERTKRTAQKMWANRKTTMYFKCKNCGQMLSVPRGKGRIRVKCPKCGNVTEKKS